MFIDVDKIPKEGLKISRDFDYLNIDLVEEDAVFVQPAHAEVTIKKFGKEILIKGRLTTCLSFICCRCLTPYEFPIDSSFDLVYLPEELDIEKEELEDDDIDKLIYYSHHLDLREIILELLNLSFPSKPLCSENCEGICAVCGKIRKNGNCACVVRSSDPRLTKLKFFIRDKR